MYHLYFQFIILRLDPIIRNTVIYVKIPLSIRILIHLYLYPQITSWIVLGDLEYLIYIY